MSEENQQLKDIANYIYECGILSKTPRSGLWFLGTGNQSVAEHTLRTIFIAYALCYLTPAADKNKVVLMSLFHDLGEGRTSDLNYVHQKYGRLAEAEAIKDLTKTLPFGEDINNLFAELEKKESIEAKLTKDADQLEFIATLRDEETKGNIKARSWSEIAVKRLKTEAGQKIGKLLMTTHPDDWWFNPSDPWFVDRKK